MRADMVGDLQGSSGSGGRRVEHVDLAAVGLDQEVLDHRAVATQGLGADPRGGGVQVGGLDARDQAGQARG